MKTTWKKLLGAVLTAALLVCLLPAPALAQESAPIQRAYGDYVFTKVSNPGAGPGEADGLNTKDITGFAANRLNSYACAAAGRDGALYIGTNRALYASAVHAMGEDLQALHPQLSDARFDELLTLLSAGDAPVGLADADYLPQILRFDVQSGTSGVIYQPPTMRGGDGALYYADRDGKRIPTAEVRAEMAAFSSALEYQGQLYFCLQGKDLLQLIRVDGADRAEVVYQTLSPGSSLRAGCVHGEGAEATLYYGGQDMGYGPWLAHRADPANDGDCILPIVIRRLDPATAGSAQEDWSGVVADFRDFGWYAAAEAYAADGGNVWDLCSYNGRLYVILAYDMGWAMFRGEPAEAGDPAANEFGWKWTEVVGDESYFGFPLAMDEGIGLLNQVYADEYGCWEYSEALNGAGLLESAATMYVFNGKLYIGSFDNAQCIQTQTLLKLAAKWNCMFHAGDLSDTGPSLTQIFAPFYEVLYNPQHVWVMDEHEIFMPVDEATALLRRTTNDYIWSFAELDGKLYAGTLDSATAYGDYLGLSLDKLGDQLRRYGVELPEDLRAQLDDSPLGQMRQLIDSLPADALAGDPEAADLIQAAKTAGERVYALLLDDAPVEDLADAMEALQELRAAATGADQLPAELLERIDWLISALDVEGLHAWARVRTLVSEATGGFDLLVTEDGEHWEAVVRDGLGDPYNYGAKTLTALDGALYLGTANPSYGAQLWKLTDGKTYPISLAETEHGSATADHSAAACGETVTVTVSPDNGYELAKLEAEAETGDALELTEGPDWTWSFPVPMAAVTVVVRFREEGCPSAPYADLDPSSWYHEAVDAALARGLMQGVSDSRFDPEGTVTRAMLVTILYRMEGSPAVSGASPFQDVPADAWYSDAVRAASGSKIVLGFGDGTFGQDEPLTREQLVTMLYRYAQANGQAVSVGADTDLSSFDDAAEISDWAVGAMRWAVGSGILRGRTPSSLDPTETATRAEIAALITRFAA